MRTRFRRLRGYLWFARRFGIRDLWRYERDRRAGMTIDYGKVFTPEERAILAEHIHPMPWEPSDRA